MRVQEKRSEGQTGKWELALRNGKGRAWDLGMAQVSGSEGQLALGTGWRPQNHDTQDSSFTVLAVKPFGGTGRPAKSKLRSADARSESDLVLLSIALLTCFVRQQLDSWFHHGLANEGNASS